VVTPGPVASAERLLVPLRLLDGEAQALADLGVPIAQIYVRAAEVSLENAIAAAAHADGQAWRDPDINFEPPAVDPRLLEWLD
jgi:hypothetical protein